MTNYLKKDLLPYSRELVILRVVLLFGYIREMDLQLFLRSSNVINCVQTFLILWHFISSSDLDDRQRPLAYNRTGQHVAYAYVIIAEIFELINLQVKNVKCNLLNSFVDYDFRKKSANLFGFPCERSLQPIGYRKPRVLLNDMNSPLFDQLHHDTPISRYISYSNTIRKISFDGVSKSSKG